MPAKYISHNFDPTLIISQIFLIFSLHYTLLIFFTILFNTFLGLRLHIDQILSADSVDFESNYGYAFICSNFFTHLFMIAGYIVVVDKANKILDYVLTNFFIHLILTTLNSQFPKSFLWWILNGAFITCLTLISEYIALKLDQREIKLDLKLGGEKELQELRSSKELKK
jgi:hypothetical protein